LKGNNSKFNVNICVGDASTNDRAACNSLSGISKSFKSGHDELSLFFGGARTGSADVSIENANEIGNMAVALAVDIVVTDLVYHSRDTKQSFSLENWVIE